MIGDELRAMTVTVESPDGSIWARVSDYTRLELGFYPFAFQRYDEPALSHQLSRLGLLTWVAWSRERTEIHRRSVDMSAEEAERTQSAEQAGRGQGIEDPNRRRYEVELNAIEAEGVSVHGTVRIRTVGMMQWQVDVEPGTLRRLGEQSFVREVFAAFEALMADRRRQIIILKGEYFDLGIPRRWREVMAEALAINRRR